MIISLYYVLPVMSHVIFLFKCIAKGFNLTQPTNDQAAFVSQTVWIHILVNIEIHGQLQTLNVKNL